MKKTILLGILAMSLLACNKTNPLLEQPNTPGAEKLPCHRVVNKEGRIAPGWSRQRTLLEEEGVRFKSNGHVDMARCLWEPEVNEHGWDG